MSISYKFSNMVYHARTDLSFTQGGVAEAVSITTRWYQRIESGEKLPGLVVPVSQKYKV